MSPQQTDEAGATPGEYEAFIQELAQLTNPEYAEDARLPFAGNIQGLQELVQYQRQARPARQPAWARPVVADAAPGAPDVRTPDVGANREAPARAVRQSPLKNRFWAPDKAFEMGLDATELAVYFLLCRRAGGTSVAWPSYHDITASCRINRRKVRPALARLLALGMIEVARPATSTKPAWYRLTPHDTWAKPGKEIA